MKVEILEDAEQVAQRASDEIAAAVALTPEGSLCRLALSGGSTPRRGLELLADRPGVDWRKVAVYQVDERLAPEGHRDRNLTMLTEALLSKVEPAEVHPMPVDDLGAYPVPLLDLVVLGLGADGHTASLLPGDPAVEVNDRAVTLSGDYEGRRRMTLTVGTINQARRRLWIITGAAKADALRRMLRADRSVPAARIRRTGSLVLADAAAAEVDLGAED